MQRAFKDGFVTETGTGIAKILPPDNPFLPESGEKKQNVIEKLKAYLQKFMGLTEEVEIQKPKPVQQGKAMEIQFKPASRMLTDVSYDDEVRRLIHNMMGLDEGTTIMQIVLECQKEFQERYFSMTGNEWRHLICDYVREVTENPQLQETEVFRVVMAG